MTDSMPHPCPTCGSDLEYFRAGHSLAVRCPTPGCDFEVATTFPIPIFHYGQIYRLIVTALGDSPSNALIALNQRFSHGIVTTQRLFSSGESELVHGSAHEIWQQAHRLRSAAISFRIEPTYPFDLDNPATAFGPPDGRLADPPTFFDPI